MYESQGRGALAQLGERLVCNQEVTGSIPVRSMGNIPRQKHDGGRPRACRRRVLEANREDRDYRATGPDAHTTFTWSGV